MIDLLNKINQREVTISEFAHMVGKNRRTVDWRMREHGRPTPVKRGRGPHPDSYRLSDLERWAKKFNWSLKNEQ
jgi:hypothetical protein